MCQLLLKNVFYCVGAIHFAIFYFLAHFQMDWTHAIFWVESENVNENHHNTIKNIELSL